MGASLTLHAGANAATRADVLSVPTPERTETHVPVPHGTLIDGLLSRLGRLGLNPIRERHGLAKAGQIWFGVFDLEARTGDTEYSLSLGLRNAHDKSIAAAILMGSNVWICDNLAMSGEIRFVRKHTAEILTDLPGIMDDAMGQLTRLERFMHLRIKHYRQAELTDRDAAYFLVNTIRGKTLPIRRMDAVWNEWIKPTHEEFAPRTAWSLFNAYTEALKQSSFLLLPGRTQRLHTMLDEFVGTPKFETVANVEVGDLREVTAEDAQAIADAQSVN